MQSLVAVVLMIVSLSVRDSSATPGGEAIPEKNLKLELRTSTSSVRLADSLVVSVFFRSPARRVTIWNTFGWNAQLGLSLAVIDASGRQVKEYYEMGDYAPPDRTGKNALMTIGYNTFAGFDARIFADELFPGPGAYTLRCIYRPPLPRDYFTGITIWGSEDGVIESAGLKVSVSK